MYIKPTGKINPEPYWYKKGLTSSTSVKQSEQKNFPKPPIV
jgi:hypothetical protein